MRLCFAILLSLFIHSTAYADCFADCLFQKGTHCVNSVCVPITGPVITPSPAPVTSLTEIRLPFNPIPVLTPTPIDCSGMDLKNLRVFLVRSTPPSFAYFYSDIYYDYKDATGAKKTAHYFARKDILNRYVFVNSEENKAPFPQFYGQDFAFVTWENPAFKDIFQNLTCEQLKKSGYIFMCGISIKGDCTDFEGAAFLFR